MVLCLLAFYWHALASRQLCSGILARVWVTVLIIGLLCGNSRCPMGQWFTVAVKCARLYVLSCSFTVRSVQGVLLSVTQF